MRRKIIEYILLNTNLLIYRDEENVVSEEVQELNRLLCDSDNFKLCIHPLSIKELEKHSNLNEREVILSKVRSYPILKDPPKKDDSIARICGTEYKENDIVDNHLLSSITKHCVSYFVTNDKALRNKAKLIGVADRVLSIQEAIDKLMEKDVSNSKVVPVFVNEEFLYNIDLGDSFFDALKEDYKGFEERCLKDSYDKLEI